jgi:fructose-1,6-bisphosphatase
MTELTPEWKPCVKLPITVHVREQRPGETHVSTREGITPVQPDDLIMRGVQGEEYPIGRELFERTYQMIEEELSEEENEVRFKECLKTINNLKSGEITELMGEAFMEEFRRVSQ